MRGQKITVKFYTEENHIKYFTWPKVKVMLMKIQRFWKAIELQLLHRYQLEFDERAVFLFFTETVVAQ